MTHTADDELLQAHVDGELAADEAATLAARLAAEPALAERHRLLLAVRRAVDDALQNADVAALAAAGAEAAGTARNATRRRAWLAAAAALLGLGVVVAIAVDRDARFARPVGNNLLSVQAVPLRGGGWPIFAEIAFELRWQGKDGRRVHVLPFAPERDLAAVASDFAAGAPAGAPRSANDVPVVLDGSVRRPDGTSVPLRWNAAAPAATDDSGKLAQPLVLWDLQLHEPNLPTFFTLRPTGAAWQHDHLWYLQRFGGGERREWPPFVPDEPGEYTIALRVVSVPPPAGAAWAAFAAPLELSTIVRVDGVASAWSKPVDGLAARVVVPSDAIDAQQCTPVALQLRNDSDRARVYNVIGVTMAPIPQPLHFDLLVDGQRAEQPDKAPVAVPHSMSFEPHAPGRVRTVIAPSDAWLLDGKPLRALRGPHTLAIRFHFVPTLWSGGDELWQGEVTTPPLRVELR
jgi:anti-sigma factor RsiW